MWIDGFPLTSPPFRTEHPKIERDILGRQMLQTMENRNEIKVNLWLELNPANKVKRTSVEEEWSIRVKPTMRGISVNLKVRTE